MDKETRFELNKINNLISHNKRLQTIRDVYDARNFSDIIDFITGKLPNIDKDELNRISKKNFEDYTYAKGKACYFYKEATKELEEDYKVEKRIEERNL